MTKGFSGSWWGLCLISLCLLCMGTAPVYGQSSAELKKDTQELKEQLLKLQEQMQTLQDRLQAGINFPNDSSFTIIDIDL